MRKGQLHVLRRRRIEVHIAPQLHPSAAGNSGSLTKFIAIRRA